MQNIDIMRGISLWQPYATLWAYREKIFETRSWATNYRGQIAIHASKKYPSLVYDMLVAADDLRTLFAMYKAIEKLGYDPHDDASLPLGAVIATAELVGCHKMVLHGGRGISSKDAPWLEKDDSDNPRNLSGVRFYYPTDKELLFGDWTPGRYAWEIANVKLLSEPLPMKGMQGLWTVPNPEEVRRMIINAPRLS